MPTLEPKGGGEGGTADFKIEWGKNQNPTENRWTKKSHAMRNGVNLNQDAKPTSLICL